ncbi:MAG TPA: 5-(carboxyamino)imidazole ribonucleotide synthase [Bacteroidales bacterium]|nr:5-(carboxyamino)imidazole ribonucleotide synthase [Bacteroidales bacterium]
MNKTFQPNTKLGIIAGGQLGKMLIQEASKWDVDTFVLDADEHCPAGAIATGFTRGSMHDFDDVYAFGKTVDLLTYEIEHINVAALKKLKSEGLTIFPEPEVLELIQDKGLQKQFFHTHKIPTAAFGLFASANDIRIAVENGRLSLPFVQKLRKGGYDGRGVAVIQSAADLSELLLGPSVIEPMIAIEKEVAVIAARNVNGDVSCFPVVEMVFDAKANLVDKLICPSEIDPALASQAEQIAQQLVRSLPLTGLLAVEFFVDKNNRLLVNEIAPRPHNSGHHTIESMMTSQFEQHLRAVLGLPLGSTRMLMPSVMINLLGEPGFTGPVLYEGVPECMAIEGVNIHLYGKKTTRPYRKMGHVTIIAPTLAEALEKAQSVRNHLKVKSC